MTEYTETDNDYEMPQQGIMRMMTLQIPNQNKNESENLDDFIGLVRPATDPYNVFLQLNSLIDEKSNIVYFFVYSMGKKKIVLWGVYLKNEDQFILDGKCKYKTQQLSTLYKFWKSQQFIYIGNYVVNRILRMFESYGTQHVISDEEYYVYKIILSEYNGTINYDQAISLLGEEKYNKFWSDINLKQINSDLEYEIYVDNEMQTINNKIKQYEQYVNRFDLSSDLFTKINPQIISLVKTINNKFIKYVKSGSLLSDDNIVSCPDFNECRTSDTQDLCKVYYYGSLYFSDYDDNDSLM